MLTFTIREIKWSMEVVKMNLVRSAILIAVGLIAGLVPVVAQASDDGEERRSLHDPKFEYRKPNHSCSVTPLGFRDHKVFIANGRYPNTAKPEISGETNCFQGFCDGEYFHRVIMGRSDEELARLEALAIDFYRWRYGLDVNDPANEGRFVFRRYEVDPRGRLQNYIAAGECVPSRGWHVADGGWGVFFIDSDGYTLGGEFAGMTVPAGTALFFGNYRIQKRTQTQDIFYRSAVPVIPDVRSEATFRCELSKKGPEFPDGPQGIAEGFASFTLQDGDVVFNVRDHLTFGKSNPFAGLGQP